MPSFSFSERPPSLPKTSTQRLEKLQDERTELRAELAEWQSRDSLRASEQRKHDAAVQRLDELAEQIAVHERMAELEKIDRSQIIA